MPVVSIITPMFNSVQFIEQTIQSVINQSFQDWEMIIVDDCSTDNSVQAVNKFLIDTRIKLIELTQNSGPAVARNTAIHLAKGKYIAFLDSDDIWLPNKLEKQVAVLRKESTGITFSSYFTINKNGIRTGLIKIPQFVNYKSLLKKNHIGNLTAIYDTEKFGKLFFLNIKHEDYAFWLTLLKKLSNSDVIGITEPLAEYRVHNTSVSSNKFKAALWTWNIYRDIEHLTLFQAIYYFSYYFVSGVVKRLF